MMENRPRLFAGLLTRRECWRLTWRGRLAAALLLLAMAILAVFAVPAFLSTTAPVRADLLIIEGWLPPSAMRQAAQECLAGHYEHVLVIRPLADVDAELVENGRYSGQYLAGLLAKYGVRREEIDCAFPTIAKKDRTYHSALAARQWLAEKKITAKSFDVMTLGPHARRSRLLYEKAFGGGYQIGIISLEDQVYDQAHWWRSSEGVREVIGEAIAYLYARILFHPSSPAAREEAGQG
jgi:hypothetical protein